MIGSDVFVLGIRNVIKVPEVVDQQGNWMDTYGKSQGVRRFVNRRDALLGVVRPTSS